MSSVSFLRHAGWFGPEDAKTLNIIGVGATGSWIGLLAAKMGFHKFQIWDADIVEDHNLPNQIYELQDINKPKVEAFQRVLKEFNPAIEVIAHNEFFTTEKHKNMLNGPLVLTVDTMSARKDIYDSFNINWKVKNVFETRLGFDYGELNIIDNLNSNSTSEWYSSLKNDDEIPDGPCNLRICTTLVNMVASYTVHTLCSMLVSNKNDEIWSYNKKTMFNLTPKLQTYSM
tara:strand:+ start:929 stop:1615 length:687 start_codon:yes stop_codon:yes gene_type:complete